MFNLNNLSNYFDQTPVAEKQVTKPSLKDKLKNTWLNLNETAKTTFTNKKRWAIASLAVLSVSSSMWGCVNISNSTATAQTIATEQNYQHKTDPTIDPKAVEVIKAKMSKGGLSIALGADGRLDFVQMAKVNSVSQKTVDGKIQTGTGTEQDIATLSTKYQEAVSSTIKSNPAIKSELQAMLNVLLGDKTIATLDTQTEQTVIKILKTYEEPLAQINTPPVTDSTKTQVSVVSKAPKANNSKEVIKPQQPTKNKDDSKTQKTPERIIKASDPRLQEIKSKYSRLINDIFEGEDLGDGASNALMEMEMHVIKLQNELKLTEGQNTIVFGNKTDQNISQADLSLIRNYGTELVLLDKITKKNKFQYPSMRFITPGFVKFEEKMIFRDKPEDEKIKDYINDTKVFLKIKLEKLNIK
jgi:hypothetical protein